MKRGITIIDKQVLPATHLVLVDAAQAEVARLRMREVSAGDGGRWPHRETFDQADAGGLVASRARHLALLDAVSGKMGLTRSVQQIAGAPEPLCAARTPATT